MFTRPAIALSPNEERALLLVQEAEHHESDGNGMKAVECYRKAEKLCPTILMLMKS